MPSVPVLGGWHRNSHEQEKHLVAVHSIIARQSRSTNCSQGEALLGCCRNRGFEAWGAWMRFYSVAMVIVALGVVVASFFVADEMWRQRKQNHGVRIGMSESEVQTRFGRPPDLSFGRHSYGWEEECFWVDFQDSKVVSFDYELPPTTLDRMRQWLNELIFGPPDPFACAVVGPKSGATVAAA